MNGRASRRHAVLSVTLGLLFVSTGLQAQQVTPLPLITRDLVYQPSSGMIYASIPASGGANANSIAVIAPGTATVTRYIALGTGTDPGALALSDDGRMLFVGLNGPGSVRRIDLAAEAPDAEFVLEPTASGPSRAIAIAVQPGTGNVVLVIHGTEWAEPQGVALYEDGVKKARGAAGFSPSAVAFGTSASTFYSFSYSLDDLCEVAIGSVDLSPTRCIPRAIIGDTVDIAFSGGRIYGGDGTIVDTGSLQLAGSMPDPLQNVASTVFVGPDRGAAFLLRSSGPDATVAAYDTSSFLPLWSFTVPDTGPFYERRSLLGWGSSGLAFRSDDTVFLIDYSSLPAQRTLRVDKAGNGTGVVRGSLSNQPPGALLAPPVVCGTDCISQAPTGSVVTLTATPDTGSTFAGWTGAADCSDGTVTLSLDVSCTATFTSAVARPTVRRLALRANDLAWDQSRGVLYAAVTGMEAGFGNSVASINPATGERVATRWVGSEPSRLALSSSAGFLHVALHGAAAARRMNLGTGEFDLAYPLGIDGWLGPLRAENIAVQPGSDTVIAIALRALSGTPRHAGVAVFDNGVRRANTTPGHTGSNEIAFADDPTVLYGYNNESTEAGFRTMAVDADGVSVTSVVPDLFNGFGTQIRSAGGRLYSSDGEVADVAPVRLAGRYGNAGVGLVAPDPASGVVFFLEHPSSPGKTLVAYDARSFLPLWSVDIPVAEEWEPAASLVRWGDTGVAFRTRSGVYIVDFASVAGVPRTLRVHRTGTGDGQVTSSPGDIQCGRSCVATFNADTTVTLTAVPAPGSTFGGWSGDADCEDGVVGLSASITCIASFAATDSQARPAVQRLALPAADVIFDPTTRLLYASIAGGDPVMGNNILSIQPATGQVTRSIWVGSEPNRLALSESGIYLYAGIDGAASIRRMELASGVLEPSFYLGHDDWYGPRRAADIHVQPGSDTVLAVSFRTPFFSPDNIGLGIFDDGVMLPAAVQRPYAADYIEFGGSPSRLYESDNDFSRLSVAADGVRLTDRTQDLLDAFADITFADGRIFAANGQVIDPETLTRLGRFPADFGRPTQVAISGTGYTAFLLMDALATSSRTLTAYNARTYALIWAVDLPLEFSQVPARRLVTVEGGQVAIATGDGLAIVDASAMAAMRTLAIGRPVGVGAVALSSGITCHDACLQTLPIGSSVTLTPVPTVGFVFAGWSGDPDCNDGQVTLTEGRVCTPIFRWPGEANVFAEKRGTGNGSVASDRSVMACGESSCSGYFTIGTTVTLTAHPQAGSVFVGWQGRCSGRGPCAVRVEVNTSVTAVFATSVRDLDRDGQQDMVWHEPVAGRIGYWYMSGASLRAESTIAGPSHPAWLLAGAADFDGDREVDLLWRNRATGENVIWFMRSSSLRGYQRVPSVPDGNWQVCGIADFNLDGLADIVWHNGATGESIVWLMAGGTGNVVLDRYVRLQTISDTHWTIAAVDDMTGDGRPDILWRNQSSGENILWHMDGTSLLSYDRIEDLTDTRWQVASTGDFDADGTADIVWRNRTTGENVLWRMNGGHRVATDALPSVTDPGWYPERTPGTVRLAPADFNQDGYDDILWGNTSTGETRIWYMNGSAPWTSRPMDTEGDTNWRIAGWGDLTGDGRPEIVWRNAATGENRLQLGAGTTLTIDSVTDAAWQIVAVADFNADGKADLVWRHATTGLGVIWFMNGGTRTAYQVFTTVPDLAWQIVGAADFDGDGKPDLVWRNTTTGDNLVWLMDGARLSSYARFPLLADTSWALASVGDYNGDGRPDLWWRHATTGEMRVWFMDGTRRVAESAGPTEADTNWVIGAGR